MTSGPKSIIYPVRDLESAKQIFSSVIGAPPDQDESYYVGYSVDDLNIGLDPHGHSKGMTGPVPFWPVSDINQKVDDLVAAGAEVVQPANDVGAGLLIATVKDADGNQIGLIQNP